jgi:hypothetical protein
MINLVPGAVMVRLFWVSSICHCKLDFEMTVAAKPTTKYSYREALYCKGARSLSHIEKIAVTFFLILFLSVVCIWLLDEDYMTFKGTLTPYTSMAMNSFGWVQYWGLFSPGIRNCNYHSTALIEFADGSSKLFEFPRTKIDQQDYLSHFGGEKKRKLFGDCMLWAGYEQFLPSIARFIARANDDPTNPPRMVTFAWQFANTPVPDPSHWVYRDQLPNHTMHIVKFIYKVDPQDLPSSHSGSANK